ncbi:acyl-CoA dehydrogenase family protein [Thermomonospora cellulosilytica]|uniref:Alkylation response protein AidB-like acyl-CoA dehydrogenase n=1 Tax=Thermomonospora cellulosilytica TaxID=1411118 RepID=A0A7W3N4I1_9ACTN|nr:acyl-CoA dehydrogenase family protein [Thermomonospora cellulosilytica]MBA9007403.1 alkylation response protein AidB-like acyl-CoA dehydrogenase [Thermomonospora cellulosilytica]
MDFDLDPTQRELRELAAGLLAREAATERLDAHDRSGAPYEAGVWKALGQAGLLGACLPEEAGGAGLGPIELAVILREVGAHVAPVPAYASLALAAVPVAEHGTPGQRALLAGLAEGEKVLTGAYREPGLAGEVGTTARRNGRGYVLDGVKTFVPYAEQAACILVPARVEGVGVGVFLVDRDAVRLDPHPAATGEPMSRIALDGVRVAPDRLLGGAADGAAWRTLRRSAVAGAVAQVSGVIEGALKITTGYVKEREQFDRKLAQFQAVTMQVGDVYIAKRALDVAMWAGVWRLAGQAPDTDEVLAIAAFNACGPVLEALYTCQHLHGGIGLDVTYPLHRYFAWGKHYAHLLGGAETQLDAIGDAFAVID